MELGRKPEIPTLICRHNFTAGSRKWEAGEVFDWQSEGIPERRVRQMWDHRWVASEAQVEVEETRYAHRQDAEKAAQASMAKRFAKPEPTEVPNYDGLSAEDLGL